MKNKKRMVFKGIIFSTFAALTLTACSSQNTSSSTKNTGTDTKEDKVINVAQIGPFSGNASIYGKWDNEGIMMVLDDVNAKGGIHGKKIVLSKIDDQGNPTISVNAAQKVVNQNVAAVFATPLSTPTLADLDVFEKAKIPQLTAGQGPELTTKGSQFIFRYNASSKIFTKTAVDYIVKKLGLKKIAVISNTDAYGKGDRNAFVTALKELGITPVSDEVIAPDAKDFTAQLTKIKAANPDVLYMASENIQSGLIAKQARSLGIKAQLAGGSIDKIYVQTAGKQEAEGTIFATQYIINANKDTKAFNDAIMKKYGEEAGFHIAKGYDGAKMLVEAMNKAYPNIDGVSIRNALRKINYHGLTGDYKFDSTGEGTYKARMGIIKDGDSQLLQ